MSAVDSLHFALRATTNIPQVIQNIARKIAALNEVAITMLPNMAIINQPYSKINFALFIDF